METKKQILQKRQRIISIIQRLQERSRINWLASNAAFYHFVHLNGPATYMKPEKRARLSDVRISKLRKVLMGLS
jgi:hypothetical protein